MFERLLAFGNVMAGVNGGLALLTQEESFAMNYLHETTNCGYSTSLVIISPDQ